MKSTNFYSELSALSVEATRFAHYWLTDELSVTARSNGFEFIFKSPNEPRDLSFFIRLNSDRVPILELPAVSINVPAGGMNAPYHFVSAAFCLVQDADCRRGILSLFGKLCDLIDDASRDA